MKPEELKTVAIMAGSMEEAYWELAEKTQTLDEIREAVGWAHMTNQVMVGRVRDLREQEQELHDLLCLLDRTTGRDTRSLHTVKRIQLHTQRLEGEVEAKAKAARAKTMAAKKAAKATAKG